MAFEGVFASMDAMVGVIAFSAIFLVFAINIALAHGSAGDAIANGAAYLSENTRLQHSIFLIERLGMNMSGAEAQLDYDIGESNYSITPYAAPGPVNGTISRLAVIGDGVYYINVDVNGS